ncbi:redoxin domain-containing protein [Actinophytocola sp.]|uniref:redoxin domain-containing protein n=1 Tax=Actinophytocola sp. TaxID=1872138 RepID=UPI003D6C2282
MARLRPALVAVIGTVLVLAGCADPEPSASAPPAAPPSATPTSEATPTSPADDAPASSSAPVEPPAKPVPEKLRFTAKTLDGKEFTGASLAGKPAMLWFWAPWCSNCQAEAPTMAEASKSSGVQFVGVAAQDQVPAMQDFVQRFGLGNFPHLADTDAAVWKRFGVTYQPAYAFVSSNGDVEVETDILEKDELLARVSALR